MKAKGSAIKVLTVVRHPVGGIRTYLKYTYGRLEREKYHFTVLTVRDPEVSLIKKDLKDLDVKVIELESGHLLLSMVWTIFLVLWKERFDLLHSHGFTAGALSVIGGLFSRVPHVMTSHDVFREDQFEGARGRLKRKALQLLFSRIDVIQSVSRDAQENLLSYLPSLSSKRLVTIRNGIHVQPFASDRSLSPRLGLKKALGMEESAFLFGFMGRFVEQKGFVYLIEAVEGLSRDGRFAGRFKVLTVNDGAYVREYRAMVEEKGLVPYFSFYGFVNDTRSLMNEIDALVMPSLWEAYGLLAAEALVMGCPVIGSDCIGLREVTKGTPALMVKHGDALALANGLTRFMTHPEPIRQQTKRFVSSAMERYNVVETARALDALFAQTLSGGRDRAMSMPGRPNPVRGTGTG